MLTAWKAAKISEEATLTLVTMTETLEKLDYVTHKSQIESYMVEILVFVCRGIATLKS